MIFQVISGKMLAMNVLITGGAGYIGSHLADRLLAQGAYVTVIDNLSSGLRENVEHNAASPRYQFLEGTVMDQALMEELISRHDLICHLAAIVGVQRVLSDPLRCIRHNVDGTQIVLALAHKHHRRVLFASTSEIYGKSPQAPFAEDGDRLLGPTWVHRWAYATGKALDEHLCFGHLAKGLDVSIVRYFNSYGPRLDLGGYASVIGQFVAQAVRGQPLTVYDDGLQSRCFTYISDTVQGSFLAATKQQALGHAFNIGTDVECTIVKLAKLILRLSESRSDIVFRSYPSAYGPGFEDPRRRLPDTRKAEALLGFRAQVSLEEGLRRTIQWYRDSQLHNPV